MPAAVDLVPATAEQAFNAQQLLNKGREIDDLPEMIEELSKNLLAKLGLLNRQDHEYENPVLR